jgi:hypothetical protein
LPAWCCGSCTSWIERSSTPSSVRQCAASRRLALRSFRAALRVCQCRKGGNGALQYRTRYGRNQLTATWHRVAPCGRGDDRQTAVVRRSR